MDREEIRHSGFAIAIAWPETYCKQPGSWYDGLMGRLGANRNYYYRAGHAALVLVEGENGKCHYFDFGRYHAPYQHGRVRNWETDPGLSIGVSAIISADGIKIENLREIMTLLQHNEECHGDGTLYASYCRVNFEKAYKKAMQLQDESPIAYGPFVFRGSNCSRFVNTCILAGEPDLQHRLRLRFFVPFTPTPMNNVNSLTNRISISHLRKEMAYCPQPVRDRRTLKSSLAEPERPSGLPVNAQWLSGEGAGSWFCIEGSGSGFLVSRFSPKGKPECENIFSPPENQSFDPDKPYRFVNLSHCKKVRVFQDNRIMEFKRLDGSSNNAGDFIDKGRQVIPQMKMINNSY